ncbi:MAG: type III-A CRISPR-associated RAMP protein Csm5 [Bacteroidetes bacterium]|nr:MAG: type III-A CRISPR-associated RAMP protein Csm5 [Bacteroidota bacterium]
MPDHVKNYRITLETLTPVFIGAGEHHVLSPYSDYVEEDRHVLILDPKKMEDALAEQPDLIDEYVIGIRKNMDNTRSTFELSSFIRNRLKQAPVELASARLPIRGGSLGKNQIRRHIADAGRPYIPGSSIKGAVRTAVLFKWLDSKAGASTRNDLLQLVRQKRWQELKRFSVQERCFGKISHDLFRFVRISDTHPGQPDNLEIAEIKRVFVRPPKGRGCKGGKTSIPQWSEVIPAGIRFTFHLSLVSTTPPNETFSFLETGDAQTLFNAINDFSFASVAREAEIMEQFQHNRLQSIYDFYDTLYERLEKPGGKQAFLRLGGGKTYFDQSIGLVFDTEKHESDLLELLKLLRVGRNIQKLNTLSEFPKTRSFVFENGTPRYPLGWVKLTFSS